MNDTETSKSLLQIRDTICNEVPNIDKVPYSASIITLNLKMAQEKFGNIIKDKFIDEFGLEKMGWKKESDKVMRYGRYDFPNQIL